MVILIGGSSHVGKTLISQKLLEKFKFPYLSLDHLKMGLIRSKMTNLTVNDDYKMRYFLFPIAVEMIKTAIENNQNLIVEGCYIPKEWKDYFSEAYLKEIKCVFIVMSENYLNNNIDSVIDNANVIEKRLDDIVDKNRLIKCSKDFKNDAISSNTPYIEIDNNYDIDELVRKVEAICLEN